MSVPSPYLSFSDEILADIENLKELKRNLRKINVEIKDVNAEGIFLGGTPDQQKERKSILKKIEKCQENIKKNLILTDFVVFT